MNFRATNFFLVNPSQEPEDSTFFKQQLKGSRLVQRQMQWGKVRVVEKEGTTTFWWVNSKDGKEFELQGKSATLQDIEAEQEVQAELCTLGIPREPWDFVDKAVKAGHPRSLAIHLNGDVMEMLQQNFAEEPYLVIKERATFLKRWTNRCKELETQESALHSRLEPHLQSVLTGKRLLLLKEMLQELEYPDSNLVDEICQGFQTVGLVAQVQYFSPGAKAPC